MMIIITFPITLQREIARRASFELDANDARELESFVL